MTGPRRDNNDGTDLFYRGPCNRKGSIADRIDADGDCWEWTGYKSKDGYGRILVAGKVRSVAHVIWEALVAPLEDGLELDHLCRNRLCVNPDHLEPVTHRTNALRGYNPMALQARQKVCKSGKHFWSDDTIRLDSKGKRRCKICDRERRRVGT